MECEKCGPIDYVLVDGYAFGDRLLEGVMFKVARNNAGKWTAEVQPEDRDYVSDLNEKKWVRKCIEYCRDALDVAQCPKCRDDVYF